MVSADGGRFPEGMRPLGRYVNLVRFTFKYKL